jgi:tetratricopeptide (TPR) repeat protein
MADESKPVTLDELKREVIEGRNLVIKTDNLLKTLHAELKQVGKHQEEFERRQWRGSAVAYGIFAALASGGALLWANARMDGTEAERGRLERQVADLQLAVDTLKSDGTAARAAGAQAAEAYRMMTALPGDERLKGVDQLAKLDLTRVTALERKALEDRAEALRREVGAAALDRGKAAYKRNDYAAAVVDLGRYQAMSPSEEQGLELDFMMGVSLNQLRRHKEAVPLLTRAVREDRKRKGRDWSMMLLAQSLEVSGEPEKALEVAREAIGQYPDSEYLPQLKSRVSSSKRALTDGGMPDGSPAVPEPN